MENMETKPNVAAHATDFFSNLEMLFDLGSDLVLSNTLLDRPPEIPPPLTNETVEIGTSSTDSNQLESNGGGLAIATLFEEAFDFPNWTTPDSGISADALPVTVAPEMVMDFSMVGLGENNQAPAKLTNLGFGSSTTELTTESTSGYGVKPAATPPLPPQVVDNTPNVLQKIGSSWTSSFRPAITPIRGQHINILDHLVERKALRGNSVFSKVGLVESGSSSSMQQEQGTGVCHPNILSALIRKPVPRYHQTIANSGICGITQQLSSTPISHLPNPVSITSGQGVGFPNRGQLFKNGRRPDILQFRPSVQYYPPLSNFRYSWTSQPVQNIWQTQRVMSDKLAEMGSNVQLNYGVLSKRPAENHLPGEDLAPEVNAQRGNSSSLAGSCLIQWLQETTQRLASSCSAETQVFQWQPQNATQWSVLERVFRDEFEVLLNKIRKESEGTLQQQQLHQQEGSPSNRILGREISSSFSNKRQKKGESRKRTPMCSKAEDVANDHGISVASIPPTLRTVQSSIYDPEFQELGQPVDPHLRLFHVN